MSNAAPIAQRLRALAVSKPAIIGAVVLLIYVLAGFIAAPWLVREQLPKLVEQHLGAKGAVEIIFRQDIGDPDKIAERTKEYEDRFANPFVAASKGFIDEVIHPRNTRRRIALGLRKLRNKQLENPWKKHDNIPL